jgi:predicted ATPase with chaperone activity
MSVRAFQRVLKLARTMADLAHGDQIQAAHLAEAIRYRLKRQDRRQLRMSLRFRHWFSLRLSL